MQNFVNMKKRLALRKKEGSYPNKLVNEFQADKNKQSFPNQITLLQMFGYGS